MANMLLLVEGSGRFETNTTIKEIQYCLLSIRLLMMILFAIHIVYGTYTVLPPAAAGGRVGQVWD